MSTTYKYAARNVRGELVTGQLQGESEPAVAHRLSATGFTPVRITAVKERGLQREINLSGMHAKRVGLKDLAIFSRQFATMVSSGLSLLKALTILAEQSTHVEFRKVLTAVRDDVEAGSSLSAAMGKHEAVFPPLMVNMTTAAEVGGFLESVLLQIAENYESEVKLRGKIKAALTYPVVVLILALVMTIAMLLFIVPVFENMFTQLGGDLPLPTKILVVMSEAMPYLMPVGIVGLFVGMAVWRKIKNRPGVRDVVDPLKFKVPVFGGLFRKVALSRFARNLGTMLTAGVPILQSLDIVAETTGNVVLGRACRDIQTSVRAGETISKPLTEHAVFPPMVVQMMAVGEDTGALDTMLAKIGEFYDQEVDATTEALTSLIEPLMIAFLGAVVGSMIVAMYLPIFKIFTLIE